MPLRFAPKWSDGKCCIYDLPRASLSYGHAACRCCPRCDLAIRTSRALDRTGHRPGSRSCARVIYGMGAGAPPVQTRDPDPERDRRARARSSDRISIKEHRHAGDGLQPGAVGVDVVEIINIDQLATFEQVADRDIGIAAAAHGKHPPMIAG